MSMLDGLTKKAPAPSDSSMTPPKGRVNDNPVRDGVAPTPKTLGPREA